MATTMNMDSPNQSETQMNQPTIHPDDRTSQRDDVQQALKPNGSTISESDPNMARDPVCGMLVDKRTATNTLPSPVNEQMGTVYFCSPECKAIFEQDPQKYGSNF